MSGRVLFVHAHPDDEASKGAATAARHVDAGDRVVLVTCTGGEAGDVLNEHHPPVTPSELPGVRAAELAAAVAIIGFQRSYLLGFHDSGFPDEGADVPPGTFAAIDPQVPARELAAVLRSERPHVVVTYPPDGGYPHPDHVRVHDVTRRAVAMAADPGVALHGGVWRVPRVVFSTGFPRERSLALHEAMLAAGHDSPFEEWVAAMDERGPRDADRPPDVRVHVADWFERRDRALRAHATQVDPTGRWFGVPRDLEARAFPHETYVLLEGVAYPDGADDLLAGLELT